MIQSRGFSRWNPPTITPDRGLQYIRELERKQADRSHQRHTHTGLSDYSHYQMRPGFGRRLLWLVVGFTLVLAVLMLLTSTMASDGWS